MSMNAWNDAKSALEKARNYVGMIGKPQRTTRKAVGNLHSIGAKTQVHFQPTDGAKNYHECQEFDRALARVIKRHWIKLSTEALSDLEQEVTATGKAARESVQRILDQIDAYEGAPMGEEN